MKVTTAFKVITNLFPNFEFASMVIFIRKNVRGISTENYVLCSFGLKKEPFFQNLRDSHGFEKKKFALYLLISISI